MPAPVGVRLPARLVGQIYANTFAPAVVAMSKTYAYEETKYSLEKAPHIQVSKQEYTTALAATTPFCISQLIQTVLHDEKETKFGVVSHLDTHMWDMKEIFRVMDGVVDYNVQLQTFLVLTAKEKEALTWRQRTDLAERLTPIVKNTYRWSVKFASGDGGAKEPLLLKSEGVPAELKATWEMVTKALAPLA